MKQLNFPTSLTLFRLIVSPLLLPILFAYMLPLNVWWMNCMLAVFFIGLSMTDFFDGYLARKYNQETVLGRVLDPIADKFLTNSALIALLAAGKIYFYWVIVLMSRELFVIGLRYVALEFKLMIPVSILGKIKMILQMLYITVLILNPYQQFGSNAIRWNGVEMGLLIATIILSMISAWLYYDEFIRAFRSYKGVFPIEREDEHDKYE